MAPRGGALLGAVRLTCLTRRSMTVFGDSSWVVDWSTLIASTRLAATKRIRAQRWLLGAAYAEDRKSRPARIREVGLKLDLAGLNVPVEEQFVPNLTVHRLGRQIGLPHNPRIDDIHFIQIGDCPNIRR